jgi:hypothetical protein
MSDVVFDGMIFDHLEKVADKSNYVSALEEEIARLRITDKEREAILAGIATCDEVEQYRPKSGLYRHAAATLRALLERMK